jgi:hypothetical protein
MIRRDHMGITAGSSTQQRYRASLRGKGRKLQETTSRGTGSVQSNTKSSKGGCANIILVGGFVRGSPEKIVSRLTMTQSTERIWDPNGTPKEFKTGVGHFHWRYWDPEFKDVLGFRGPRDLDKPVGQWNLAEAIADGDKLVYYFQWRESDGRNESVAVSRSYSVSVGGCGDLFPPD